MYRKIYIFDNTTLHLVYYIRYLFKRLCNWKCRLYIIIGQVVGLMSSLAI